MQAILTRYIGATNTKPSRIKAWTATGRTLTRSYDDGSSYRNAFDRHAAVAKELAASLNWQGEWIGGADDKAGYVFVRNVDPQDTFTV